jgi:predicted nucleic acid-binding protein
LCVGVLITDDQACRKSVEALNLNIRCHDTLTILAALDLQNLLPSRDEVLRHFLKVIRPVTRQRASKTLRAAYQAAASIYRFALDDRELGRMASTAFLDTDT